MVEGLKLEQKFTLINAPAGSGKTTLITNTVKLLAKEVEKNILCITFTNRAADQLKSKIKHKNVEIGTIHSFVAKFIKPFFSLNDVIDYYIYFYKNDIENILSSNEEKNIKRKERYVNQFDLQIEDLTVDIVKENLRCIKYGETPYSSYLYGTLSHDDLLSFTYMLFKKFPKLKSAIKHTYSHVFIDEYQDTSSDILNLFYEVSAQGDTKLILLGDEMQQIYPEALGRFQDIIDSKFKRNFSLKYNWRSQKLIVDALNGLYFDDENNQEAKVNSIGKPIVNIVENISEVNVTDGVLQLVLLNSELFRAIGAYNLYSAYKVRYPQHHKYQVKAILSDMTINNYDDLLSVLVFTIENCCLFEEKKFNELIERNLKSKLANQDIWHVRNHIEKVKLNKYLTELKNFIEQAITIEDCLKHLKDCKLFKRELIENIIIDIDEDIEFKEKIMNVHFQEVLNCHLEMKNPRFSTQHAVKGEGHEKVALKLSDSSSVNVNMYFFLEIFSKGFFDYKKFNLINTKVNDTIEGFVNVNNMSPSFSSLKAPMFNERKDSFDVLIMELEKILVIDQNLYNSFYKDLFTKYKVKPGVTTFKNCIREVKKISGAILAYKLLYVGCSRAKNELSIYITKEKSIDFVDEMIQKFESIGFIVKK